MVSPRATSSLPRCSKSLLLSASFRSARAVARMSTAAPIDDGDWAALGGHLERYDSNRENLLKQSREIQKRCKQAVFHLHQGAVDKAAAQLAEAESTAKAMTPTLQQFPSMRQGACSFAMEEYVEAVVFKVFLEEGRLARSSELPLAEPEEYLGGVLDFTDELSRHAIQRATARDTAAVGRCRDIVDAILGQFLQFDLRNSSLRKKYDGLKYTLKKLENTMYELSLVEALPVAAPS